MCCIFVFVLYRFSYCIFVELRPIGSLCGALFCWEIPLNELVSIRWIYIAGIMVALASRNIINYVIVVPKRNWPERLVFVVMPLPSPCPFCVSPNHHLLHWISISVDVGFVVVAYMWNLLFLNFLFKSQAEFIESKANFYCLFSAYSRLFKAITRKRWRIRRRISK